MFFSLLAAKLRKISGITVFMLFQNSGYFPSFGKNMMLPSWKSLCDKRILKKTRTFSTFSDSIIGAIARKSNFTLPFLG